MRGMMRVIKFRVWDDKIGQYINLTDTNILPGNVIGSELNSVVIEQCTEIKDKNGVDIYEGDIVNTELGVFCEVMYHAPVFRYFGVGGAYGSMVATTQCVVVGNIHKNPELLEGGSND